MASLIDSLYNKHDAELIHSLWEDDASIHYIVRQQIGTKILAAPNTLIDSEPDSQIMCIVSLAPFADSEDECVTVSGIICWGYRRPDVSPLVTEHQGKELAARCLLTLSFFRGVLERRFRHGGPSPDFYRRVGMKAFHDIGMEELVAHFRKWETFLPEVLVV